MPEQDAEWQNHPATDLQKEKLAFFGCEWEGGITKGQASDALTQCARGLPDKEREWQARHDDVSLEEKCAEALDDAETALAEYEWPDFKADHQWLTRALYQRTLLHLKATGRSCGEWANINAGLKELFPDRYR